MPIAPIAFIDVKKLPSGKLVVVVEVLYFCKK